MEVDRSRPCSRRREEEKPLLIYFASYNFKNETETVVPFLIDKHTPLATCMWTYISWKRKTLKCKAIIRFSFGGSTILNKDTPAMLSMENESVVVVYKIIDDY